MRNIALTLQQQMWSDVREEEGRIGMPVTPAGLPSAWVTGDTGARTNGLPPAPS
jgi:hypothetical protein